MYNFIHLYGDCVPPNVTFFLNKEEMMKFEKLCKEEECTPYALAKKLVMDLIKSRGEEPIESGGLPKESDQSIRENSETDRVKRTENTRAIL